MSMGYGATLVCGDYKGKLKKVVKVLNALDYSPDDLEFRVVENYIVAESCGEYPSAIPIRKVLEFPDGRRIYRKESDEALIEEWENDEGCDEDDEEVSLKWLSENVSPLLTKGTLEIVAIWNEKLRFAAVERLIIRHDGFVESHVQRYDADAGDVSQHWTDAFDPRAPREKKRAA